MGRLALLTHRNCGSVSPKADTGRIFARDDLRPLPQKFFHPVSVLGRSEPPIQGVYMPAFLMTDAYFRYPAGDLRLMNGKCVIRLRESFGLTGLKLDLDQYMTVDIGIHMSFEIRGMYHRRRLQQESSQVREKRRISDSFL